MNFEFKQRKIKPSTIFIAVFLGLLLGSLFILLGGFDVVNVYSFLIKGSLGGLPALTSTIRWSTIYLICGIASGIAFKGGVFNMGTEGQLYMGAMAATLVGIYVKSLPVFIHIPLCMLVGMLAGMTWALLPAILKVYWNTNEIVVTLMMNYIAIHFTSFLVKEFFLTKGDFGDSLTTDELLPTAQFPRFRNSPISFGFILGITLIVLFIIFFDKTTKGFEIKVSGFNPEFAKYSGISVNHVRLSVMLLSGAIAGLAGASEIMGVQGRFLSEFSPDFGTDGMLVALLGNSNGIGILISSLFMGMLKAGSLTLERSAGISRALAVIIQALIICFISIKSFNIFNVPIKLPRKNSIEERRKKI
ncbi:ABC transporter permease [Blautia liquoris]|uniref:ABC transporter permease n=1 Tax=Blautia liquoris TaxID=2779518 RepID=A0A7M2RFC7_9FIRM|nr:ABC transporter permease [Blautia liquoris]QOV18848.1 ABC transporter permease [Blautia liquoris]